MVAPTTKHDLFPIRVRGDKVHILKSKTHIRNLGPTQQVLQRLVALRAFQVQTQLRGARLKTWTCSAPGLRRLRAEALGLIIVYYETN